jgi:hypothetical protein
MERIPEVPTNPQEIVQPGEPTGPVVIQPPPEEPQNAPGQVVAQKPTLATPALKRKRYKVDPGNKASKHFKVPGKNKHGEASAGKLGRCECGKPTPLKYGNTPMCPICARGE